MAVVRFKDASVPLPAGYNEFRRPLLKFRDHHPRYLSNVFVMMSFENSKQNKAIAAAIRSALAEYGLVGLRADDGSYSPRLWDNVSTYLLGCRYGVAVFEKSAKAGFNPNVAIELGFSLLRNNKVLILKDSRIRTLPADIVGNLYHQFDPKQITKSVKKEVGKWAGDLGFNERAPQATWKQLTAKEKQILAGVAAAWEKAGISFR